MHCLWQMSGTAREEEKRSSVVKVDDEHDQKERKKKGLCDGGSDCCGWNACSGISSLMPRPRMGRYRFLTMCNRIYGVRRVGWGIAGVNDGGGQRK